MVKPLYVLIILIVIVLTAGLILMSGYVKRLNKGFINQTSQSQKYCGDGVCDGPETPENCPEDCEEGMNQTISTVKMTIKRIDSTYKTITKKPSGWFHTGQNADVVLSWFDFNYSGGPLIFNHPMGIASDGKRLLLADTRNNRVLIWNNLPTSNTPPNLVLGQKDFIANEPGTAADKLRWPVDVATDGKRVIVADTFNHRVLIWNEFPTKNGEPADIILGQKDFETYPKRNIQNSEGHIKQIQWPWAVWTNGKKLIITNTERRNVMIWNSFPTVNNQEPNIILENEDFGTPRSIESDGETYLIVGDHNAIKGESVGGTFFWSKFPESGDTPYDAFVYDILWNSEVIGDNFYASNPIGMLYEIKNFKELRGTFKIEDLKSSGKLVSFQNLFPTDGDGSGLIYINNGTSEIIYASLYNGGRVVGYFGKLEDKEPDFVIGSETNTNPLTEIYYFMDNNFPISYNDSLISFSDFNRRIEVWKNIPDESGALPDIVYDEVEFNQESADVYKGKFYLIGKKYDKCGILAWNWSDIIEGKEPELIILKSLEGCTNAEGITFDDKYAYIVVDGYLYVWKQPVDWDDIPFKKIELEHKLEKIKSNGELLAALTTDKNIILIDVDSIEGNNPTYLEVCSKCQNPNFNLPGTPPFIDNEHLFVADTPNNRVLIWSRIPSSESEEPDIVIGKNSFDNDLPVEITKNGLFWPRYVWFDGNYLWVGEHKFSGRLLRFPVG